MTKRIIFNSLKNYIYFETYKIIFLIESEISNIKLFICFLKIILKISNI